MTNAIRHGRPRTVALRVAVDRDIVLSVHDDGAPRQDAPADGGPRPEGPTGDGYGLLGIRERVDALGGSFDLTPSAVGMVATARLPL